MVRIVNMIVKIMNIIMILLADHRPDNPSTKYLEFSIELKPNQLDIKRMIMVDPAHIERQDTDYSFMAKKSYRLLGKLSIVIPRPCAQCTDQSVLGHSLFSSSPSLHYNSLSAPGTRPGPRVPFWLARPHSASWLVRPAQGWRLIERPPFRPCYPCRS
jgi:hypothetical protein